MWFQSDHEPHALPASISAVSAELSRYAARRDNLVSEYQCFARSSSLRSAAVDLRSSVSNRLEQFSSHRYLSPRPEQRNFAMHIVANATAKNPLFFMRVYVDQLAAYFTYANSIDTQIFVAPGQHKVEVMAEDKQGYISDTIVNVTVTSQAPNTTISGIQNMPGWQSCGATFPAGSGRDGQVCAAGKSDPMSTMTEGQTSPAMDGKSTKFTMSGPNIYSNELYFNAVAGGDNVSHFTYDLYFYVDNGNAPQALESDLNQTFGGRRWVWGSECNFKGETPPLWDIWDDDAGLWRPTNVPCIPFPSNQWIHLIWTVERVNEQVHYISLQVNDQVSNIDTYYNDQPGWTLEEIDTAFQMDMPDPAIDYNVWLDEVNLTAW